MPSGNGFDRKADGSDSRSVVVKETTGPAGCVIGVRPYKLRSQK